MAWLGVSNNHVFIIIIIIIIAHESCQEAIGQ